MKYVKKDSVQRKYFEAAPKLGVNLPIHIVTNAGETSLQVDRYSTVVTLTGPALSAYSIELGPASR